MVVPRRWMPEHIAQVHPEFWPSLAAAILAFEARHPNIDVAPTTLHRSNGFQAKLRAAYERDAKLFAEGKISRPPLPAAKPGASAHNYDRCTKDVRHDVRGADGKCPRCGAVLQPATLAADVQMIVDGAVVPTGGGLKLEDRPAVWRWWAEHLRRYPALRDGGTFPKPDTPHVEDAHWDFKTGARRL